MNVVLIDEIDNDENGIFRKGVDLLKTNYIFIMLIDKLDNYRQSEAIKLKRNYMFDVIDEIDDDITAR